MNSKLKFIFLFFLFAALAALLFIFLRNHDLAIFSPRGVVASGERDLIKVVVFLMLIVVIPFLFLFYFFAWKYRATNDKARYEPNRPHSATSEIIWWVFLFVVVTVLSFINWQGTHALDPYKPLASNAKPLTIQVVALNWKWLFIYPEQNIATVNFIEFPARTTLNFELTADAPMNSFWIPELGGQIYAMAGMTTQTHLMADAPGEFMGSAAEINGKGFSGMRFKAVATSENDFNDWLASVEQSSSTLTLEKYKKLAEPSEDNPKTFYSSVEKDLYNTIMMQFIPSSTDKTQMNMDMSNMSM